MMRNLFKNLRLHFSINTLALIALLAACSKAKSSSGIIPVDPSPRATGLLEGDQVVILPSFVKSEAEIAFEEQRALKIKQDAYDLIAGLKKEQLTFKATFKALDVADANFGQIANRLSVVGSLAGEKSLRDAANDAASRLEQFAAEQALRSDVYKKLEEAAALVPPSDSYDARLVENYLRAFKKNGANKTEEEKVKIAEVNAEISKAKTEYETQLSEAMKKVLRLSKEEVASLPTYIQEMVKKYETPEGYNVLRGNLNVWFAIMTDSDSEPLRKKAWINRYSYARDEATPSSLVLVNKRKELAKLLGYKSWAAYQTDGRMAGTPESVDDLYAQVIEKLEPIKAKENEKFTALKRELSGDPNAVLQAWDLPYIEQHIKKTEFDYDPEALRDYFPLAKVKKGIFDVYGTVYGVKFSRFEGEYDTWYPGVDLYSVKDSSTGKLLGVLYLDLFARAEQGKRTGAWMNQVIAGQIVEAISFRPSVQVVTNFRPIAEGAADSYLSFDEMSTFFHEFGHAMHSLVSSVPHASLTIDGVAWDFVETPSQIMEDFLTDYKVLSQLSAHKETGEPLPESILKKVNDSGKISTGYSWMRQIALGQLDWSLYNRDIESSDLGLEEMIKLSDSKLKDYWIDMPDGLGFVGAFSHINSGGYSAGYYSYLWAAVVAADCSEAFKNSAEGYLNPELGMKWRTEVLSQGNAKNAGELVKNFLGREYNSEAFIRSLQ
ncbi:MAG: M3 family metallopeptidase [Bdellovibrionota bacterium]